MSPLATPSRPKRRALKHRPVSHAGVFTPKQLLARTRPLSRSFFQRPTIDVARDLLGKVIVHRADDNILAGMIVETEAYLGEADAAAHASRGITKRTAVIFGPPGRAYVYLCYGMYECLNLVAEPDGKAGCVLIRALEPLCGLNEMQRRRVKAARLRDYASGPGKLTLALGITRQRNGADITRGPLAVRAFKEPPGFEIVTSTRIGIHVAVESPFRFYIQGNEHVSAV